MSHCSFGIELISASTPAPSPDCFYHWPFGAYMRLTTYHLWPRRKQRFIANRKCHSLRSRSRACLHSSRQANTGATQACAPVSDYTSDELALSNVLIPDNFVTYHPTSSLHASHTFLISSHTCPHLRPQLMAWQKSAHRYTLAFRITIAQLDWALWTGELEDSGAAIVHPQVQRRFEAVMLRVSMKVGVNDG